MLAIVATKDGGYLLGGYSYSGICGDKTENNKDLTNENNFSTSDYWVIKIDGNGNKLWDKTYGGSNEDGLTALVVASDGGFLLAGYSNSNKGGDKSEDLKDTDFSGDFTSNDFWVLKIDDNGNKLWDKTYGGNGGDILSATVAAPDGGYLLGGYSESGVSSDKSEGNVANADFWAVKIDAAGQKQWDRTFGTESNDAINALLTTPDGGFLLGGTSLDQVARVIKVDASGKQVWNQTYNYTGDFQGLNAMVAAPDGGYLLGGWAFGFWLFKIDENGQRIWDQSFEEGREIEAMLVTTDGDYVLGGHSNTGGRDYYVLKVKEENRASGSWDMRYGGSGTDNLTSVIKTADGGYLAGGACTRKVCVTSAG